ncbi:SAM-dependent methyltransferase [Nocardia thraciensis]
MSGQWRPRVGVDISPAACAEALREVAEAGLADRITIHKADGVEVATTPLLESVQLVVTLFSCTKSWSTATTCW